MKGIIITTTILEPTEAIKQYDAMQEWQLIVTGDRKSPKEYPLKRGSFISWDEQQAKYPDLCELVGPDSTARGRMIGIIEAWKQGADVIATIDDDNYPYENWGEEVMIGKEIEVKYVDDGLAFDPVRMFFPDLWHRGFPLELLNKRYRGEIETRKITPLLQADLWNGDPDVDATVRIARHPNVTFTHNRHFAGGKFCPVNSQNTFISGKYAMDYCPFAFIGRAEDIWGGYVFQALHPESTIYGPATVLHAQNRSVSSLVQDLEDELFGYRNTYAFLKQLCEFDDPEEVLEASLPTKAFEAWKLYRSYFK